MTTFKLEPVCSYPGHSDLADHPPCFQGEASQAEADWPTDPADVEFLASHLDKVEQVKTDIDQQDDQPAWAQAWQAQAEANRADPDFGQGNGPIVWSG